MEFLVQQTPKLLLLNGGRGFGRRLLADLGSQNGPARPAGAGAKTNAVSNLVQPTCQRLPLRNRAGPAAQERALELRQRLLDRRADAPLHFINGSLWLRISAFAYNEIDDYERLAELIREL